MGRVEALGIVRLSLPHFWHANFSSSLGLIHLNIVLLLLLLLAGGESIVEYLLDQFGLSILSESFIFVLLVQVREIRSGQITLETLGCLEIRVDKSLQKSSLSSHVLLIAGIEHLQDFLSLSHLTKVGVVLTKV